MFGFAKIVYTDKYMFPKCLPAMGMRMKIVMQYKQNRFKNQKEIFTGKG